MKVLLIQPPLQDFYTTPQRLIPLGLCSLKAVAKKFLPEVEVLVRDFHHGKGKKTIALPSELSFLRPYYPESDQSPFSVFGPYYHFGASFEEIVAEVQSLKPDLIGISSLFTPYHREVLTLARELKRLGPTPILLGGPHATACPEVMMRDEAIDFIIRAEGEKPFVEFLKAFQGEKNWRQVSNLVFREEGEIIINPLEKNYTLAELPWPERSDFSIEEYCLGTKPLAFIMSSRGCPWNCHFCSVHQVFCEGYRERAVEDIVEEMKFLYEKGVRIFDFEDDNLTFNKKRFLELCSRIEVFFPQGEIELTAMNGVSYLALDRERLEAMKRAGFRELNLSLVSANAQIQKENERPFNLDTFTCIVNLAHDLGFKIVSYQILGLPGESLESMKETLKLLAKLPVLVGASPFYVPPGTPVAKLFPKPDEKALLRSRLTSMGPYENLRDEIFTFFIATRIINFLKSENQNDLGKLLLERLFKEKELYGHNKKGFFRHTRFKKETFAFIWNDLSWIMTQEGKKRELLEFTF